MSENISLNEGIRRFEKMQLDAGLKLTKQFSQREEGKTKYDTIYFSKPEVRARFDYFK